MGFVEFKASDVVDFNRRSPGKSFWSRKGLYFCLTGKSVSFSRPLKGGTSTLTANIEVTPFLSSQSSYTAENPDPELIETARLQLPLAKYILCHPIPSEWEIRRDADRGEGWFSDGVYFRNKSTGQNTAMLWLDPLASKCPNASLEPLPSGWKRDHQGEEATIIYRDAGGQTVSLADQKKDGTETFEPVLEPFLFSKPGDFYGQ